MKDPTQTSSDLKDAELSKNLFHLKTLYDVCRVLLDQEDIDRVLRNFLLMTMGSFGVMRGFIFMQEDRSLLPQKLSTVGLDDGIAPSIEKGCHDLLLSYDIFPKMEHLDDTRRLSYFPPDFTYVSIFNIAYACNGILALGPKLTGDPYSDEDAELFETLVIYLTGTLKNIRSTEALKSAFREVSSINQAKTKVINHLSHELKTPLSILETNMALQRKYLSRLSDAKWMKSYERSERSLKRLSEIQRVAGDIMKERVYEQHRTASTLLNECAAILESFAVEQLGEGTIVERIRNRIDEVFLPVDQVASTIVVSDFVKDALSYCRNQCRHRRIDIRLHPESTKSISIPKQILSATVQGILKNAVENTPDESRIDVWIKDSPEGIQFVVHDFGTGIVADERRHIFSGFYPTQETDSYATRKPYDFNAGGKGTDLLRFKIFSESYAFKVDITSERCGHIPTAKDECPGSVTLCEYCKTPENCHASGNTTVTVVFPCR